jgi:hypothetical protein
LPGASLRPPLAFNPRPRRLSTPTDAFQLHPAIRPPLLLLRPQTRARADAPQERPRARDTRQVRRRVPRGRPGRDGRRRARGTPARRVRSHLRRRRRR